MRVGVVALQHESNTFLPARTTIEHFREDTLAVGSQVTDRFADSNHEVGGFLEELDREHVTAVPIVAARAIPHGTLTDETLDQLVRLMFDRLDTAGPLDGVLVAPHGAMVSESRRDADGWWLAALRHRLGAQVPLIGTIDPHANLSSAMVEATDALIAYRTNPHVDQRERGIEAAKLMVDTLRGRLQPTQSAEFPPLLINIERQHTDDPPYMTFGELAHQQRAIGGAIANSLVLGFPYADVAEMGTAVIAVTDGDPTLAGRLAGQLGARIWGLRQHLTARLVSVEEALDRAERLDGPVCLLDMGDNVGGGSPADGTWLALALRRRRLGPSLVCLYDPASVARAAEVGIGGSASMRLGGHSDALQGPPLEGDFEVIRLGAGTYRESLPRHGGSTEFDQGAIAIVRGEGELTVLLNSKRTPPFSLQQLTSCGLKPELFRVVVAKGVHAPVAAYQPVCRHLIRVNTPGYTAADLSAFCFTARRRPLFPFEDAEWIAD